MSDNRMTMDDAKAAMAKMQADLEPEPAPAPIPIRRSTGTSAIERCRRYVAKMPPAIAGQNGHNQCFAVACTCFRFGLDLPEARQVMDEFSSRCQPPWSDREIDHKIKSASAKVLASGTFGAMLKLNDASLPPMSSFKDADPDVPAEPRFKFHTLAEFDALDLRVEYHIPGVLAAGPVPTMMAGYSKTLKTSIAMDMLVSLATGTPFLRQFETKQCPVAIMSGESGGYALQDLERRICRAIGVDPRTVDNFHLCTAIPSLGVKEDLLAIEEVIIQTGAKVFAIDPTYMALRGMEDAGNFFAVAPFLEPITELGRRTGCTPVLIHHNSKGATRNNVGEPAELADMAFSGFSEWAGQWLLLNRRRKYNPDQPGDHELWMTIGGRDGHSGCPAIDVREGAYPDRHWTVNVNSAAEVRRESQEQASEARDAIKRERFVKQREADKSEILVALGSGPDTKSSLRDRTTGSTARVAAAIADLLREKRIVQCEIKKNNQPLAGFELA